MEMVRLPHRRRLSTVKCDFKASKDEKNVPVLRI
jgi:hypothetical protein